MRSRDRLATSVLRFVLSELHNREIQKRGELAEEEAELVLAGQVKKHQDSIAQFQTGGRADLAQKEQAELRIIQSYLPAPLPESDVRQIVKKTIAELSGAGEFGKVMSAVMPKLKGRAAGQIVSRLVKEELNTKPK